MTCAEAREKLSLYIYGELDFTTEELFEQHVSGCECCRTAIGEERRWHESVKANAVEPPQQVQDALKLYDEMKSTVDDTKRVELFKQILEIAADQFYSIGIKSPNEGFGIRKNNMRNIPDRILNSFGYPAPAPTNPEQYFKA